MPDFGKDITTQQISNYGNQQSPIGQLIGNILQRYMYQADQSGAMSDQLLGGVGYGRANPNANPFYGGMYNPDGTPYAPPGSQHNPTAPGGGTRSQYDGATGATAGPDAGQGHPPYNQEDEPGPGDPDFKGATGGGGGGEAQYGPGYNASDWQYPEGGVKGGIIGDLESDTGTEADDMWADRAKWFRFGNADDADLLGQFQNLTDTGFYSQADDSASKNWAQMFREQGASESEANAMAADLAKNPNKYESVLADFATKSGKYDDKLGTAYGSLLDKPGFSDEERIALEQKGQMAARSAADALRSQAEKRAANTGNASSGMATLASIGRDTTRGLGEQARENVLAQAAQRRADIDQGGKGISNLQGMIDARMGALEGVNQAENARRLGAMGAKTQLSGQEIGRMTSAAQAASQRAENLAARKMAGLSGKAGMQNSIMAGQQAGMQAGMGQQAELAARKAARLQQKMGLQNQLAQQQFGSTGGMGQVAGQATQQYGVTSGAGGGI
jgi:hypothetical protein